MQQPDPPSSPSAAAVAAAAVPASVSAAPDTASVRAIIFGVMVAMLLSALDQTIVASALPAIGRELRDVENLSWVVTAYLIAATAVTPLYGKLSDIHGRRTVLMTGIAVFVAGSIACAFARTMPALILARAVQGLGGGGLIALSQTIIADVISPKRRGRYQAHFGAMFAASNVAGAVLGGYIAEHLHWSLIFWLNLPLGALALTMVYRALARLPQLHRPHHLDIVGAVLMASATVSLLLALTWGGTRFAWTSWEIAALFGGSAVLWALFVVRLVTTAEPFLPLPVLANPIVRNAVLAAFFGMGALIGMSIYVPVYFQAVLGLSPSHAGLGLIPVFGCSVVGATISGRLMIRVVHYKRTPLIGLVAGALALATLALEPVLPTPLAFVLLAVFGMACGSLFPITAVALQNAVRPHQIGTATAAMNFSRQLGGAVLVAGFGAILLGGVGLGAGAGRAAELIAHAGPGTHGLSEAFRWVFAGAACSLVFAWTFLFVMEERPLGERAPGDERGE